MKRPLPPSSGSASGESGSGASEQTSSRASGRAGAAAVWTIDQARRERVVIRIWWGRPVVPGREEDSSSQRALGRERTYNL
jgi:hypothetical protein